MSFQSMAWAVKQNTKNSISKLILLMLANYADEEHACYPSITHIAELCHCSERSVKRHIKDLRIRGYIKIGKIKGRVNNCNRYILGSANATLVTESAIGSDTVAHNTNIKQSNILNKVKKNKNFLAG
jgi:pyocin large subunit-like protein